MHQFIFSFRPNVNCIGYATKYYVDENAFGDHFLVDEVPDIFKHCKFCDHPGHPPDQNKNKLLLDAEGKH